jgi:hypothetical protein
MKPRLRRQTQFTIAVMTGLLGCSLLSARPAAAGGYNLSDITGANLSDITGANLSDVTGANLSDVTGANLSDTTGANSSDGSKSIDSELYTQIQQIVNDLKACGNCSNLGKLLNQARELNRQALKQSGQTSYFDKRPW